MTLDKILEEINKANSIVILTHENPDGDAIGSSLAMYNILKAYGKNPDVIIPEYSKIFEFLPGTKEIKKESQVQKYDLAISLDCPTIGRLNGFASYFENAKSKIVIDHHGTNTMFGDLNYVNPDAPACAQILIVMFEYFGFEISKDIATCIITGIITDTGGFAYSGVTAETFEFAASLLKKGVNVSDIYKRVLQTTTKPCFELTRVALNRLEFFEEGKVAFTYITQADMQSVDAKTGDHEGIVEIGRNVEDVEVSVFAREIEDGWRLSLRSNQYINVSDVCIMFGGGGHPRAAGATITGNIEEVKEKDSNELIESNDNSTSKSEQKVEAKNKTPKSETKQEEKQPSSEIPKVDTDTKKDITAWDELGITEDEYYNSPAWSWAKVDFAIEKYGSQEECLNACIEYGESTGMGYSCSTINSFSGRYLGEMLKLF